LRHGSAGCVTPCQQPGSSIATPSRAKLFHEEPDAHYTSLQIVEQLPKLLRAPVAHPGQVFDFVCQLAASRITSRLSFLVACHDPKPLWWRGWTPQGAGEHVAAPCAALDLASSDHSAEKMIQGVASRRPRSSPEQRIIDGQRRIVSFALGLQRLRNYPVAHRHPASGSRRESLLDVPHVRPGGENLLHLSGLRKVEKALQAINAVEALGNDPADAAAPPIRGTWVCRAGRFSTAYFLRTSPRWVYDQL
jgi:hypothetical protein